MMWMWDLIHLLIDQFADSIDWSETRVVTHAKVIIECVRVMPYQDRIVLDYVCDIIGTIVQCICLSNLNVMDDGQFEYCISVSVLVRLILHNYVYDAHLTSSHFRIDPGILNFILIAGYFFFHPYAPTGILSFMSEGGWTHLFCKMDYLRLLIVLSET